MFSASEQFSLSPHTADLFLLAHNEYVHLTSFLGSVPLNSYNRTGPRDNAVKDSVSEADFGDDVYAHAWAAMAKLKDKDLAKVPYVTIESALGLVSTALGVLATYWPVLEGASKNYYAKGHTDGITLSRACSGRPHEDGDRHEGEHTQEDRRSAFDAGGHAVLPL